MQQYTPLSINSSYGKDNPQAVNPKAINVTRSFCISYLMHFFFFIFGSEGFL